MSKTLDEQIDEILTNSLKRAYFNGSTDAKARESGVIPNDTKLGEVMVQVLVAEAKQALTSLTKELVEEAKPGTWVDPEDTDDLEWQGYVKGVEHFEQNLLKALEEK